jgi:replicative DNA helicase
MKSVQAERAILGSCLIDKTSADVAINLEYDDFYSTAHQEIFKSISNLIKENTAIDIITLTEQLKNENKLESIGGVSYLTLLMDTIPVAGNVEHYIKIVKQKSNQRKIFTILENVKSGKLDIQKGLNEISQIQIYETPEEDLKTLLKNTILTSDKGVAYKFKIPKLNKYLGGVDKGELITIGGFTSQGKSSFVCQLAIDFAGHSKKRVLYCSSEMTPMELSRRILSNEMDKNIMDFRSGYFQQGEKEAMTKVAETIGDEWNLNIKKVATIEDIRKYINKYDPEIVFVDYLQNLDRRGARSDYERVSNNIKDLQGITLDREIVTFVVSQLSRNKERIRPPRMTDLRDSGRIEEVSNIVMLIYWENRLKEKTEIRKGGEPAEEIEIRITKNRDGTIGNIELEFYPEYSKIMEEEKYEIEY